MEIITNNKPRDLFYFHELPAEQQEEYFNLLGEDAHDQNYICYKKVWYCMGDFMRTDNFPGWSGYSSDSFFSGVLLKFTDDSDSVVMGTYLS